MKKKRRLEPMSLKEVSEIVGILQTAFRDVFVQETRNDGRVVIVAREHFRMKLNRQCFCGGETIPSSVAGFKAYFKQQKTYSTEDGI